jgi:hypothetical protein
MVARPCLARKGATLGRTRRTHRTAACGQQGPRRTRPSGPAESRHSPRAVITRRRAGPAPYLCRRARRVPAVRRQHSACIWAIPQASGHPTPPTSGRVLSRKALARRVTGLAAEPVPDADASYPLIPSVRVQGPEMTNASVGLVEADARVRGEAQARATPRERFPGANSVGPGQLTPRRSAVPA